MFGIVQEGPDLVWRQLLTPTPNAHQVRIRVTAAGVNRADLVQRAGHYRPPPGASDILGLECAGVIDAIGPSVTAWKVGDRVCALLSGGGYAQQVVVHQGSVLPIPDGLTDVEAAALPEVWTTAHLNVFQESGLRPGQRVLLHAGASGVGTAALQLCVRAGNPCMVVVGNEEKVDRCIQLGAEAAVNRHESDWWEHPWLKDGVDLILDPVGADSVPRGVRILRRGGLLVVIGLLSGRRATIDLGPLLVKRLRIQGSVLRARTDDEKAAIINRLRAGPWPGFAKKQLSPVIHGTFAVQDADAAHQLLAKNQTIGKLVLIVPD